MLFSAANEGLDVAIVVFAAVADGDGHDVNMRSWLHCGHRPLSMPLGEGRVYKMGLRPTHSRGAPPCPAEIQDAESAHPQGQRRVNVREHGRTAR